MSELDISVTSFRPKVQLCQIEVVVKTYDTEAITLSLCTDKEVQDILTQILIVAQDIAGLSGLFKQAIEIKSLIKGIMAESDNNAKKELV